MKKTIIIAAMAAYTCTSAQNITISHQGSTSTFPLENVDSVYSNGENHIVRLAHPISLIKRVTFQADEQPDLSKPDNATAGNTLQRLYFTPEANPGRVLETTEATKSGNTFSVFLPYVTDFSQLKPSFESSGTVWVEGAQQKSGITANDFSHEVSYKVLSEAGDVQTYTVRAFNSHLPVLNINTTGNIPLKVYSEGVQATLTTADNQRSTTFATQVKAKGSRYTTLGKRTLNLKTDKKEDLLGTGKSKRYTVLSNKQDATMLRTQVALAVANSLDGLAWTPNQQPVELILGGKHMGTHFLAELPRIATDRVKGSSLWSTANSAEPGDAAFSTAHSRTTCILEDAAEELTYAQAATAFATIDKFEETLFSSNFTNPTSGYRNLIDENSFVDWIIANEVMKNTDASFYFYIDNNGRIAMGPVDFAEDHAGNNGQTSSGFATRNNPWMERLMQDPYFAALVCSRFSEKISDIKTTITSATTEGMNDIASSATANEHLWNTLGMKDATTAQQEQAYKKSVDELLAWFSARLSWLETALANEQKFAKTDNPTAQNEIRSFKLSKQKNSKALLADYTATIEGDSIKIFVPYLVHYNLVPEFEAANGATVYAENEPQTSGSSSLNFLKPVTYKVVAQNGDVRTYKVCIFNSGIPVLYINTPGAAAINSKEVWVENTDVEVYLKDGYLDYTSGTDKANIKGRGNSTWDASPDKRPYALKLNKKSEILGMLEHKRWVLMANYYDATFFRNELANYLAKKCTNTQWSPSGYNVELVLNGQHKGNYYLCEQVRMSDTRIEGDYLVEADRKANSGQIKGVKTNNYFNIKDPKVENNSQELQYVKGILDKFENTLYGQNFLDKNSGYKTLADLESFVDWYLIKELSKDYDGNMFTSCYCHIMPSGQIKMGPIWDFDLAFGGNPFETLMGGFGGWGGGNGGGTDYAWYNQADGYHIASADWFVQLWKDPEFVSLLRQKVDAMVEDLPEIMAYIDQNTQLLTLSASANKVGYDPNSGFGGGFGGWGGWGGSGGNTTTTPSKTYAEKMQVIKDFVTDRLLWLQQDLRNK